MSDEQDVAESVDEEMVGADAVTSDEVGSFGDAPIAPSVSPFADADVTDESLADRVQREVPEDSNPPWSVDESGVVDDGALLEQIDADGELAEPD